MSDLVRVARELAETLSTYTGAPGIYTLNESVETVAEGLADALLDAGLLADDAAAARAEAAEQAVQRVRERLATWDALDQNQWSLASAAAEVRRALDGTP